MKKIIIIAITLFIALESDAQFKIGVKGGWTFENFNISGSVGKQLKKGNSVSWDLGIVTQANLAGGLYLQPELLYTSQKIKIKDSSSAKKPKLTYLQVPVNLLYKIKLEAISPFIEAGPYIGYAISRNDISKKEIKKTDWGVGVGAGIELLGFQVSAKYNWGLRDISKIRDIKWKNNKFNVSVALFI
ncbi:MAG: PorT family protein [Prevotellaceae bacterium]|nr:PorT family protein [Prevotellaceae bacterium]